MPKRLIALVSAALFMLSLACNFPGFPSREPAPGAPDEAATATYTPTPEDEPPAAGDDEAPTSPTETLTITPSASPTISATATVTATPTLTITLTPTPVPPGPPLAFEDPDWELVEWHPVPDSGDWEGSIRLHVQGGTPPYRAQLEDHEIVQGLELPVRWRRCKAMPATVRAWSADGQMVETKIWIWELGCEDD